MTDNLVGESRKKTLDDMVCMCGGYCSLVNTTNQLLTKADSVGAADIEPLRNLNNELLTENAELRNTVQHLKVDYLDVTNELDRTRVNFKKVNNVDKTLAAMFHAGKRKGMKGKGCMVMPIEVGSKDMGSSWHWSHATRSLTASEKHANE